MKVFNSYAIGQIKKSKRTSNQTYIFIGENENYKCEVVEGDVVSILKFNGQFTEDTIISVDVDNHTITFEKIGEVFNSSLMFIGKQ